MIFSDNFYRIAPLCVLVGFGTASLRAQTATSPAPAQMERLVVPDGAPLRVILTEKLRFKLSQPVHARIVEPVYGFDREVVPEGANVVGHITGFKSAPRWMRITSMLGGNFT